MKDFALHDYAARMRYHDLPGEEPPIVFIHGLGCASSFDYPQVASSPALAGHRRILVDLLGAGFSDKPEEYPYTVDAHASCIDALIRHLGLSAYYLYGHSMGGAVAITASALSEAKPRGLVLSEANLDSGGGFFSRKIAAYDQEAYTAQGHAALVKATRRSPCPHWAASLEAGSPLAVHRESVSLVHGATPSWREVFLGLPMPKTFIFGEQSLPDPDREALGNSGVHIEIVPEAGHSMAWDNPGGLALAIANGIAHAG